MSAEEDFRSTRNAPLLYSLLIPLVVLWYTEFELEIVSQGFGLLLPLERTFGMSQSPKLPT
jgi:hypothetical protein